MSKWYRGVRENNNNYRTNFKRGRVKNLRIDEDSWIIFDEIIDLKYKHYYNETYGNVIKIGYRNVYKEIQFSKIRIKCEEENKYSYGNYKYSSKYSSKL